MKAIMITIRIMNWMVTMITIKMMARKIMSMIWKIILIVITVVAFWLGHE